METAYSLEHKLNNIIENEFEKDVCQIDDRLVLECCNGILRLDNIEKYLITQEQLLKNKLTIIGERVSTRHKNIKVILIAAAIAVLLTVMALGYAQVKYNIFHFSDHSEVRINLKSEKAVNSLDVKYIPEGFTLIDKEERKTYICYDYSNGALYFSISKKGKGGTVSINTEYVNQKIIVVDNVEYIIYGEREHGGGVLWSKDDFVYQVIGGLDEDELLKIATHAG